MPSGRPISSSCAMTPEWSECRSPALRRTRWRRPALSMRTMSSPAASARGSLTPRSLTLSPLGRGDSPLPSLRLMGADQAVPVRMKQLAAPAFWMQLIPRLSLRRLDYGRQLRGQLRGDSHRLHPFGVVPVELARPGRFHLETGCFELRAPLVDRKRQHVRGIAALLDLVQHISRRRRRRAVDERRIAARSQHAKGFTHKGFELWEVVRRGPHHVDVERLVGKGQRGGVPDDPVGVLYLSLAGKPLRHVEHLASEVEAYDATDERRQRESRVAGASGDVQGEVAWERPDKVDDLLQALGARMERRSRVVGGDWPEASA